MGDSDVFMDVGSSLNLTCVVSNVNAMLKFIIWNHKNKVKISTLSFYTI